MMPDGIIDAIKFKPVPAGQVVKRAGKKALKTAYLGTWKFYTLLRDKHRYFLAFLNFFFGNIGIIIISAFLVYYAIKWYPYYGVINYIIGIINGPERRDFLYNHVIPWALGLTVVAILLSVFYFTAWDMIFPRLYLVRRDGEEFPVGRAYFYSPETKIVYANLDRFLNPLRPITSLRMIHVEHPESVERAILHPGHLLVHAEGIVHLHDDEYAFTDEPVPQADTKRDIIERTADENQAYVEYRTSRALRYNPEINKTKYRSTVILLPATVFKKTYRAPEESTKGILENLRNRIDTFEQINEQALTDEEVQEDLSQKLAPLLKEIYEYSRALEERYPMLKPKNDEFYQQMLENNMIIDNPYFNENMNVRHIPLDLAREYVANVRAVLEGLEWAGVVEE